MFHVPAHKQLDPAKQAGQIVNPIHNVKAPSADFAVTNHGSIVVIVPISVEGRDWASDNLPDAAMCWAGGYAIHHNCFRFILEGIVNDGLEVV